MKKEKENLSQKQNPNACKNVLRDYSCYLTCKLYDNKYQYEREKCCEGKRKCIKRINRWTGKQQVDGVRL